MRACFLLFLLICSLGVATPKVETGLDVFFNENHYKALKDKKVGLITNHTGINGHHEKNVDLFKRHKEFITLKALFCPEHGANGAFWAEEPISHSKDPHGIPFYSLHGSHRRPTPEMLKGLDTLIYDIQEIGCRSYTYATTLFYVMEEAAKAGIEVIVLDRPNPLTGLVVDGPMLKNNKRSFQGYVNVPYCHGMTIGELARFFNEEYKIGCKLKVVLMKGWKRHMAFADTGLPWIPTSPYIPEPDTPYFYASTGILGTMDLVNIGIGYTLPFKVIGAPWIVADSFAARLNEQKLPGVYFVPFFYKPFYGKFKGQNCQGVKIHITSYTDYRPLAVQYLLLGVLKSLYPDKVERALKNISKEGLHSFCQVSGNDEMFQLIREEKYIAWKLIRFDEEERKEFLRKRKSYLLY